MLVTAMYVCMHAHARTHVHTCTRTHCLEVGRPVERIPTVLQQFDEIIRYIPAGEVDPLGQMRDGEALPHGDNVRDAVA
jgi:hypothetical protein